MTRKDYRIIASAIREAMPNPLCIAHVKRGNGYCECEFHNIGRLPWFMAYSTPDAL